MESKVTSTTTKGLILALILIVISIIITFTDSQQTAWGRWLGVIILLGGIIWACISYGKQLNDNVTFGNVFGHGFKVCAVTTVLMILFTVIFLLLDPSIKEKAMEQAREQMSKNPDMTKSQIDQGIAFADRLFYVFAIGGILFIYLITGVIASLIGAAVAKKSPANPFQNS